MSTSKKNPWLETHKIPLLLLLLFVSNLACLFFGLFKGLWIAILLVDFIIVVFFLQQKKKQMNGFVNALKLFQKNISGE